MRTFFSLMALVAWLPFLSVADPLPYHLEVAADGLEIPWDIDFAPDGRVFVTERPGRIRVIEDGALQAEPWAMLPVANWRAAGLSGLALSPDFADDGFVFVMGTFRVGDDRFVNRVIRFREVNGRGAEPEVIVGDIPSISTHAGGALDFGPDRMLYVGMGDAENIALVQQLDNTTGKILRYAPDGSIPDDNPDPGSPVWTRGVRNPQGFAWHSETGRMFSTEHGPSGFPEEGYREHQDELMWITRGGNQGWPIVSGMHMDGRFEKPLLEWTPAIAPSGLAIVNDPGSPWHGDLLVGAMRAQHLRRVVVDHSGDAPEVVAEHLLYEREFGRIRAVEQAPDGSIWFSTSNADTPGEPVRGLVGENGDLLYRLVRRY